MKISMACRKIDLTQGMKDYAEKYPHYSFEENAGYGTTKHIEGIKKFGTCDIHRMSFLKNIL